MNALPQTSLDRVLPGQVAAVLRVEGDDVLARRLVDLGFWPGTQVEVVRRALWGDPTEYRLRGFRMALRQAEAGRVIVVGNFSA